MMHEQISFVKLLRAAMMIYAIRVEKGKINDVLRMGCPPLPPPSVNHIPFSYATSARLFTTEIRDEVAEE